jgi:hypothetical protein
VICASTGNNSSVKRQPLGWILTTNLRALDELRDEIDASDVDTPRIM